MQHAPPPSPWAGYPARPGTDVVPAQARPDTREPHERPAPTAATIAHWAAWHHPHHISTGGTGMWTRYQFRPFTGEEPEPVGPPGVDELLCGSWQDARDARTVHDRIAAEVRAAHAQWTAARIHNAMARTIIAAQGHLAAWRDASVRLGNAFAAVDFAPDNMWRSTIAALVAARSAAEVAARPVDDLAGELEELTTNLPERVLEHLLTVGDVVQRLNAAGHQVTMDGWPERGYGESLASMLGDQFRDQDDHIAEINRLAGDVGRHHH